MYKNNIVCMDESQKLCKRLEIKVKSQKQINWSNLFNFRDVRRYNKALEELVILLQKLPSCEAKNVAMQGFWELRQRGPNKIEGFLNHFILAKIFIKYMQPTDCIKIKELYYSNLTGEIQMVMEGAYSPLALMISCPAWHCYEICALLNAGLSLHHASIEKVAHEKGIDLTEIEKFKNKKYVDEFAADYLKSLRTYRHKSVLNVKKIISQRQTDGVCVGRITKTTNSNSDSQRTKYKPFP